MKGNNLVKLKSLLLKCQFCKLRDSVFNYLKMSTEEVKKLERLIRDDKVDELSNILNSNDILRNNFNTFLTNRAAKAPLLLYAVRRKRQKVVEYLLSQDFVDKYICNKYGENIYHVICGVKGAEELFSIIERKVPHHLLLNNSNYNGMNELIDERTALDIFLFKRDVFDIACEKNNVFIVKRVHEILETLQLDLTPIKNSAMEYATRNKDIEVIKYFLSIYGIQLKYDLLFEAIRSSTFDIIVYLLNIYLCQSIPSHLHNQFHIFQFSNSPLHQFKYMSHKNKEDNSNNKNNDDYFELIEENYKKILDIPEYIRKFKHMGNRIWHVVCGNKNIDVVKLIFSLKGIQAEILNDKGNNPFLLACKFNSNIKVIKYIHKLFPSFIHSLKSNSLLQNGAFLVLENRILYRSEILSDKLNILHYLYLNGIDIHLLTEDKSWENYQYHIYHSLYTVIIGNIFKVVRVIDRMIIQYLKVISQDFDYQKNEHDHNAYKKPSFWKELNNNNNKNNNNKNKNIADEQSMRVNEWKNRFDEHVLHHLSKMIQEWMLDPNQYEINDNNIHNF